MSIHVSTRQTTFNKKREAYCIGNSIFLAHVRYIVDRQHRGLMYHSPIISSNRNIITLGCKRQDVSGICLGHKMSRKEFLERYCNGIEPRNKTTTKCQTS